jgi:hypothetical protein
MLTGWLLPSQICLWAQEQDRGSAEAPLFDNFDQKPVEVIEVGPADYYEFVYSHRRVVYEWQHFSSKVIFWVVIVIVVVGLLFSGLQFYMSLRRRTTGGGVAAESSPEATELEASLKGIKVRSSVLGVIILVIALGFLYLYLVHVYPIRVTPESVSSRTVLEG